MKMCPPGQEEICDLKDGQILVTQFSSLYLGHLDLAHLLLCRLNTQHRVLLTKCPKLGRSGLTTHHAGSPLVMFPVHETRRSFLRQTRLKRIGCFASLSR